MDEESGSEEEWIFDEVTGRKRPTMAILNRRRLTKYEMDELFASL